MLESQLQEIENALNEIHNLLTVGDLSLMQSQEIYKIFIDVCEKIDNIIEVRPNQKVKKVDKKEIIPSILSGLLTALLLEICPPVGLIIYIYFLNKVFKLFKPWIDNIKNTADFYQANEARIDQIISRMYNQEKLFEKKLLRLAKPNALLKKEYSENETYQLSQVAYLANEFIGKYLEGTNVEIPDETVIIMARLMLQKDLNTQNDNLLELLEMAKTKYNNQIAVLNRVLPHNETAK